MTFVGRLGLAVARPKTALALAGDREYAGRSGSDLLATILMVLVATQLRALVAAAWLGGAVAPLLGVRAAVAVFTDALTVALAFLLVGALIIWAVAGGRRDIGRAFDLACVAVLPIVLVDLVATVVVHAIGAAVPREVVHVLSATAYAWTAALVVLAARAARTAGEPAAQAPASAKRAGWGLLAIAGVGIALQLGWLAQHMDRVRPMTQGDMAPAFVLPRVGPDGKKAGAFSLRETAGKVTIVDFWATWCGPCLRALPQLDRLQRAHPEIAIVTINIDDAADARELFTTQGYSLTLLAGDQATSDRYGVAAIPHTVVIDRTGRVVNVLRGGHHDLERVVTQLLR